MKLAFVLIGILAVLFLIHLFLLTTRRRREAARPFMEAPYAHRGLFDKEIPENSLAAFQAAVDAGFGIELDVQLSSDGEVMVFHDESLTRMTGCEGSLYSKTREELACLRLLGTDEHIPTFKEVLACVDGKVPLLVEIKSDHAVYDVCRKTAELLDGYAGAYMIESFHPFAVNWFRKNRPQTVRGQLSARLFKKGDRTPSMFLVQNLLLNFLARPDFVAYDYHHKNGYSFSLCRFFHRPFTVAWTVRDKDGLVAARSFDAVIFESLTEEELRQEKRLSEKKEEQV